MSFASSSLLLTCSPPIIAPASHPQPNAPPFMQTGSISLKGSGCKHHFKVNIRYARRPASKLLYISATTAEFPKDYVELLEQVKYASQAALKDSKRLLEIEFPTAGLDSVSGDAEGGIEMNISMTMVRDFCLRFLSNEQFTRTRIFFPDVNEVDSAKNSVFEGTSFKLDYLTKPSGLEDIGFSRKVKLADRVKPTDEIFVIAYPYFNVNEMLAVEDLYRDVAADSGRPIIVFNGELDRIRSGSFSSFQKFSAKI